MKCIQCYTENRFVDRKRNDGRCKHCNHPFVFEPVTMTGVKITDLKFRKAIEDISANNTLFFTETQLAYFLDHRLRQTNRFFGSDFFAWFVYLQISCMSFSLPISSIQRTTPISSDTYTVIYLFIQALLIYFIWKMATSKRSNNRQRKRRAKFLRSIGVLISVIAILILMSRVTSFMSFALVLCMGVGTLYLGDRQLKQPPGSKEYLFSTTLFEGWLNHWKEVNQGIPKLLSSPRLGSSNSSVSPDISAYSFDRLVVCDRPEIAQLLIANNFHFENNCAVLSITEYPESIFKTTMQMLYRNPDLKVYAVHDCSAKGLALAKQLQSSDRWFRGRNVTIVDIGITPSQVMSSEEIFIHTSAECSKEARLGDRSKWPTMSQNEIRWLEAGNYVELESLPPQRLIQIINRGIIGSRNVFYDGGYDSGVNVHYTGSDSFG